MNSRLLPCLLLAVPLALAACIQKDETMSFYVRPDGKVDVVIVDDNVRSDKAGEEGRQEEKEWLSRFKSGDADHQKDLRAAKARRLKTELLKDDAPYSAVLRASFDSAEDLGRFFGMNEKDDKSSFRWTSNGDKRELRFHVAGSTESRKEEPSGASKEDGAEAQTAVRFIAVGGRVTQADGFRISADSTTCVLDWRRVDALERKGGGYDVFMAWTVR